MKRQIVEWIWRTAIVCALGWIGWELHQLRVEMQQPVDDQSTAEADPLRDNFDELSDQVATLKEKVDAMMIAMMQLKR